MAFDDLVRGHVEIDAFNLGGDFVIVRSDGTPLYHFTVVVDDAAMDISHVIRGEDHLSNTPKHILLFRALGHEVPAFAHLPLILNPDRTKMSKRKSQTAISDYVGQGFIREALVNYLALLGWSTGHGGGDPVARGAVGALRPGARPEGRRGLRSRAARVAERPVDPEARAGRPRRAAAAVPEARARRRADRSAARRARSCAASCPIVRERLPRLDAVGDLVGFLWVDDLAADPAMLVPKRWDAATTLEALAAARDDDRRRPERGHLRGRRARAAAPRAGRGVTAGRSATCSCRSASRSPAGRRRRRCSTRSSRSVATASLARLDRAIELLAEVPA